MNKKKNVLLFIIIFLFTIGLTLFLIKRGYNEITYIGMNPLEWLIAISLSITFVVVIYDTINIKRKRKIFGSRIYSIFTLNARSQKFVLLYFIFISLYELINLIFTYQLSTFMFFLTISSVAFMYGLHNKLSYIADKGIVYWGNFYYWSDIKNYRLIDDENKIEIDVISKKTDLKDIKKIYVTFNKEEMFLSM